MININHFHQEVVSCPTLSAMIKTAPRYRVTIMSANTGVWPWVKAVPKQHAVLVGVNANRKDLSSFWNAVREYD